MTSIGATVVEADENPALSALRHELDVRFNVYPRRFAHLDPDDADLWSELHGIPEATYSALIRRVRLETVDQATALLPDRKFLASLRTLGAADEHTTVVLGDSITADRGGWLAILTLAGSLTGSHMSWINSGVSGDTTTHGLARFDLSVAAWNPSTVVIMLGTNDARRSPTLPGRTLVSPSESEANIRELVALAHVAGARVVLVTPPPVNAALLESWTFELDAMWRNEDLELVSESVRRVASDTGSVLVDLWPAFTASTEQLHLPDGLHPGPLGQRVITRELVVAAAEPLPKLRD